MHHPRRPDDATAVHRLATTALLIAAVVVAVTSCGGAGTTSGTSGQDGGEQRRDVGGPLLVSVSASIAAAITDIATAFEDQHPDTSITINIANSAALAAQIDQGAPVDVFATADEIHMRTVVDGVGTRAAPVVFATNEPRILVAAGNPFGIADLTDLTDPDLVVIGVVEGAAIGRYVADILESAGVELRPRSFEETPVAAATKVRLGEADATIVFATDVLAIGELGEGIPIPPEINVAAPAVIAIPTAAPNSTTAVAFVEYVLDDTGRAILESYGFGVP